MGKVIPTTSFRRAQNPDPQIVEAFVNLNDAPGHTPLAEASPPAPVVVLPVQQTATEDHATETSPPRADLPGG